MKAITKEELRIGDLVKWDNSKNEIETIRVIGERTVGLKSDIPSDTLTPLSFFEPIPLTEEWLLKFGFESDSLTGLYICYKLGYFKIWHDVKNNTFLSDNVTMIKLFIQYVHSLQNLYFALTNNELEIK